MRKNLLLVFMTFLCVYTYAQSNDANPTQTALDYLSAHHQSWQLEADDIGQMRVTDQYLTKHNGVTHVYFIQQYGGIDISGATYNANILHDDVLIAFQRLVPNVASKILPGSQRISAEEAVSKTIGQVGAEVRGALTIKERIDKNTMVFDKGQNSLLDIPVHLVYTKSSEDMYTLAWEVTIESKTEADLIMIQVDASNGDILGEVSLSLHCSFPDHFLGRQHDCDEVSIEAIDMDVDAHEVTPDNTSIMTSSGAQYTVVPIPFESPNHSARRIVTNPADEVASPYGWHDQDGVDGAEQTTTFGNNVYAFIDRDGDYEVNEIVPDGGAELHFDFPLDLELEPEDYQEATATNLFYMNNVIHDVTYNYGFDEAAGNFQFKNYSGAGREGDYVLAHSQFGAGTADPPLNNATFGTPSDGGSGRMRMYLWAGAGANQLLTVEEPSVVAGAYNTATTAADWGVIVSDVPVTGEVVIVEDGTGNPSQGCNELVNGDELDGKIALIDRGSCDFSLKAFNAQEAGAIGFIVCNFDEGLVTMGGGSMAADVTIPGVFIANSDCQKIRAHVGNGLIVSLVNKSDTTVAQMRSGSFDNGIVAHEFGHGVSNRLTGGPSLAGCLQNYDNNGNNDGEQMGEGWSDFFTLITSVKPNDTGEKIRGVGTYATGRDTNAVGIRPFPYTTDMGANPMTYDDIAFNSVPHGVGTVWCTMLWDLYWALSDEYGWDADLYHGTGGNNLAIQLIMDGMKMQPCNPGFIDGRDAILASDTAMTGGENGRIIWEVFARRGLGWSADQGVQERRLDGTEAFDMNPVAIQELKVTKDMTPMIEAGQEIDVTLSVYNHKPEGVEGVALSDILPAGSDIVAGSESHPYTRNGDMIVFDLGNLATQEAVYVTYRLSTSASLPSESFFFDDMEDGQFNWAVQVDEGTEKWELQSADVYSGNNAWLMPNVETESDVSLLMINTMEITGDKPVLTFYHRFNTEKFGDYGILQITSDGGLSWNNVPEAYMVRQGYSSKMPYGLFAIPNIRGWNGSSDAWVATLVDLSEYTGQSANFRWRFGSDDNTSQEGWFLDDVEIMDAYTYNSEACVTSAGGDDACAQAPEWGTVVESGIVSAVEETQQDDTGVRAYPNPARDILTVEVMSEKSQNLKIELVSSTGITLWAEDAAVFGNYRTNIAIASFPRGFYFIRTTSETENKIIKVLLQ